MQAGLAEHHPPPSSAADRAGAARGWTLWNSPRNASEPPSLGSSRARLVPVKLMRNIWIPRWEQLEAGCQDGRQSRRALGNGTAGMAPSPPHGRRDPTSRGRTSPLLPRSPLNPSRRVRGLCHPTPQLSPAVFWLCLPLPGANCSGSFAGRFLRRGRTSAPGGLGRQRWKRGFYSRFFVIPLLTRDRQQSSNICRQRRCCQACQRPANPPGAG